MFTPHQSALSLQFLEEKGIRFMFKTGPKEFVGKGGKIKEVVLKDDTRLPADLCILGIGRSFRAHNIFLFRCILK